MPRTTNTVPNAEPLRLIVVVLAFGLLLSTRNLDAPNTIREYSTADKTPNEVDTFDMFELSGCPLQDDPASNEGSWCDAFDICLPTCVGPKLQIFLKTDYMDDSFFEQETYNDPLEC